MAAPSLVEAKNDFLNEDCKAKYTGTQIKCFFPQQGFWKSQAYIATQYPLEDTTNDFWRMVWQEHCRSVVMLVSKEELQQVRWFRHGILSFWGGLRDQTNYFTFKIIFFLFVGKREKGFPYPYVLYLQRRALTDPMFFVRQGREHSGFIR